MYKNTYIYRRVYLCICTHIIKMCSFVLKVMEYVTLWVWHVLCGWTGAAISLSFTFLNEVKQLFLELDSPLSFIVPKPVPPPYYLPRFVSVVCMFYINVYKLWQKWAQILLSFFSLQSDSDRHLTCWGVREVILPCIMPGKLSNVYLCFREGWQYLSRIFTQFAGSKTRLE